jgi:hypothetical protein
LVITPTQLFHSINQQVVEILHPFCRHVKKLPAALFVTDEVLKHPMVVQCYCQQNTNTIGVRCVKMMVKVVDEYWVEMIKNGGRCYVII